MIVLPIDRPEAEGAEVSAYFGEVPYFVLCDLRGQVQEVVENPCRNQGAGGGERLSRFLAELGAERVLFRHLGDKLFGWLRGAGIESYAVTGEGTTLAAALQALREGRLERVTDANLARLLHPAGPGNGVHCHHHD